MLSFFRSKNKGLRIGLCLSEHSLALVVIDSLISQQQGAEAFIKNSFCIDFSGGESSLASARNQVIDFIEQHDLKRCECFCVLNKQDYQLLLVEPPEVPESELVDAMHWKVRDLANVDTDTTVINIFPQPEKNMVYTVVAEKQKIQQIVSFVKDIGLSLVTIDIEELAYRNFFERAAAHVQDQESILNERGVAVIHIAENEGRLLIIKNGNLFLSRRFSIGYGAGVFDELPEDEIILELQRSLDYYERQMRQAPPAEIVFCGAISDEKITVPMRESFQQHLRCVDLASILGKHVLTIPEEDALVISGAALRRQAA